MFFPGICLICGTEEKKKQESSPGPIAFSGAEQESALHISLFRGSYTKSFLTLYIEKYQCDNNTCLTVSC